MKPELLEIMGSASSSAEVMQRVRTPYGLREVAAALLIALVLLPVGLLLLPWQQSVRGDGRVVAYTPVERQQLIEAPIEGRVLRFFVREGSRVKAGERIVEITDNDPGIMQRLRDERDAMQARLEAARARQSAILERLQQLGGSRGAAISGAGSRVRMAEQRMRAASEALAAAEAAKQTAQLNKERQQALYDKGLTSKRSLELAELESLRTTTETARALAALQAARGEKAALRADQQKVTTDAGALLEDARAALAAAQSEVASATAEIARIEVRLARQASQSVIAPRDGVILRLLAAEGGEMVKAGDGLAVLVPDAQERAVELWIDGNDVPLLSEGRSVRLQFEGWPAVQFVGWPSVAVGTFPGRVALIDATDNGKGKFRILVLPEPGSAPKWPSASYLRQGVRVHGWVLLSRVRLGYELWRQWNGFPPVVAPSEPADAKDALGAKTGDKKGGGK
jgi:multidrug resistance efflux pump